MKSLQKKDLFKAESFHRFRPPGRRGAAGRAHICYCRWWDDKREKPFQFFGGSTGAAGSACSSGWPRAASVFASLEQLFGFCWCQGDNLTAGKILLREGTLVEGGTLSSCVGCPWQRGLARKGATSALTFSSSPAIQHTGAFGQRGRRDPTDGEGRKWSSGGFSLLEAVQRELETATARGAWDAGRTPLCQGPISQLEGPQAAGAALCPWPGCCSPGAAPCQQWALGLARGVVCSSCLCFQRAVVPRCIWCRSRPHLLTEKKICNHSTPRLPTTMDFARANGNSHTRRRN
ncbi:uncharacterized protein LOC110404192 [Numida meleagris]|uniref:uncharacterized protein LOC110404192 n=1 Tax=Numida meleagris TaxID=8996 RepID=UPI000B3D9EC0|nr:uncharacterized protein LOC110404192 [Numida meleagris]